MNQPEEDSLITNFLDNQQNEPTFYQGIIDNILQPSKEFKTSLDQKNENPKKIIFMSFPEKIPLRAEHIGNEAYIAPLIGVKKYIQDNFGFDLHSINCEKILGENYTLKKINVNKTIEELLKLNSEEVEEKKNTMAYDKKKAFDQLIKLLYKEVYQMYLKGDYNSISLINEGKGLLTLELKLIERENQLISENKSEKKGKLS